MDCCLLEMSVKHVLHPIAQKTTALNKRIQLSPPILVP
jgi:hypothetical protein